MSSTVLEAYEQAEVYLREVDSHPDAHPAIKYGIYVVAATNEIYQIPVSTAGI
jgi:hypothetical protein